jgi:enoyl-CoA hydratase/carnithine racemase
VAYPAPTFDQYRDKYANNRLTRGEDGVLLMQLHTNDGPFVWSAPAHDELGYCFTDIACDRENKVLVMTGTGDNWCENIDAGSFTLSNAGDWDRIFFDGRRLLRNLLDIEIPVVSAINGPARIHPEIPVLSDIVIAADTTLFQDAPHYMSGIVPGDGAHVVWLNLLGSNRGRYFLMMGEELVAEEARRLGIIGEVVPPAQVLDRAMTIARDFAAKPPLTRRYTRVALTQKLKRLMAEGLDLGLSLEALAAIDQLPTEGRMSAAR